MTDVVVGAKLLAPNGCLMHESFWIKNLNPKWVKSGPSLKNYAF